MERNRPHCPRLLFRFPWEVSPRAVLDYYRENRQFLVPWDPPRLPLFYTEERQQSYLGEEADAMAAGQALYWYLTLPEKPEQVIGSVQLTRLTGEPELGYKLSQSQAGKGLGTEAVRAVLELARTLEIPRVTALVRPENHPSRRLLEKRYGGGREPEGSARGQPAVSDGLPGRGALCGGALGLEGDPLL